MSGERFKMIAVLIVGFGDLFGEVVWPRDEASGSDEA
jgi:hypothetical protein